MWEGHQADPYTPVLSPKRLSPGLTEKHLPFSGRPPLAPKTNVITQHVKRECTCGLTFYILNSGYYATENFSVLPIIRWSKKIILKRTELCHTKPVERNAVQIYQNSRALFNLPSLLVRLTTNLKKNELKSSKGETVYSKMIYWVSQEYLSMWC